MVDITIFKGRISLRIYMTLILAAVIMVSIMGTGYMLVQEAKKTLLEEKQHKLFALAKLMDDALQQTFAEILERAGASSGTREEKINVLNKELSRFTDFIAGAEPGIGVGYYSKDLDAIITYGPSDDLGQKMGQSISQTHQGREVMRSGEKIVQTGKLVRGAIMNCMLPIIRNGQTIGYIWSNELLEDINIQIEKMLKRVYLVILIGLAVSFICTTFIANMIASKVNRIKNGLKQIQKDLNHRISPVGGEIGEIVVAINEMADALTERKKLEEQMQRADRMASLGEIAAGVAHEIRNPLTTIRGFVQFIDEDFPENDSRHEFTGIITKEVDRLNRIVEELMFYARPSETQAIQVDLNQILEYSLRLANFDGSKNKVQILEEYDRQLPLVSVDGEQIKQVFLNLMINSRQAVATDGEIKVTTRISDNKEFVEVVIADNGSGIKPENLKRLFDPFFTTRETGTGLGLAVAQKIVELHGGQIEAESTLGKGSSFSVYLPINRET